MKKNLLRLFAILVVAINMSSCVKETVLRTYTYTLHRPIYSTTEKVRSEVGNATVRQVKNPGKLYILGSYIYLVEQGEGIHIINNANPANPVNEAFIKIPGCEDIAANGTTLYADCYTDLFTIDISNPKAVKLKNYTANIFPDRQYIYGYQVANGNVVTEWIIKDTTVTEKYVNGGGFILFGGGIMFDKMFSNFSGVPSTTAQSAGGANAGKGGSMARFAIQNNRLYAVTTSKLNVVNISNPNVPNWTGSVNLNWGIETIYPFKDKLFVGSQTGMYIFSLANPDAPVQTGTFAHARVCDPVIGDDNTAYVTLRNGSTCAGFINQMDVVNVSNIFAPTLIKSYPLTNPRGLSKENQWLFICDGKDGLKVFDATTNTNIILKKTIAMAETFDVIAYNNIAIVSAKDGLYQYDYSNINDIQLKSKMGIIK